MGVFRIPPRMVSAFSRNQKRLCRINFEVDDDGDLFAADQHQHQNVFIKSSPVSL